MTQKINTGKYIAILIGNKNIISKVDIDKIIFAFKKRSDRQNIHIAANDFISKYFNKIGEKRYVMRKWNISNGDFWGSKNAEQNIIIRRKIKDNRACT